MQLPFMESHPFRVKLQYQQLGAAGNEIVQKAWQHWLEGTAHHFQVLNLEYLRSAKW